VLGINGRKMFETWYQAEALLRSGRVDLNPIISNVLPLEAFEDVFTLMRSGSVAKIVLDLETGASS
jgi:threonine 3-dehydrogenase